MDQKYRDKNNLNSPLMNKRYKLIFIQVIQLAQSVTFVMLLVANVNVNQMWLEENVINVQRALGALDLMDVNVINILVFFWYNFISFGRLKLNFQKFIF